ARTESGEESLGQRGNDLPLRRTCVLRLIDQDVIDAAVELVQHPGGRRCIAQERAGAMDEVIEVVSAASALGVFIFFDNTGGEPQQTTGGGDHLVCRLLLEKKNKSVIYGGMFNLDIGHVYSCYSENG